MDTPNISDFYTSTPSITQELIEWAETIDDLDCEQYDTDLIITHHQLVRCRLVLRRLKEVDVLRENLYRGGDEFKHELLDSDLTLKQMENQYDKPSWLVAQFLLGRKVLSGSKAIDNNDPRASRLHNILAQYNELKEESDTISGHCGDPNGLKKMAGERNLGEQFVKKDLQKLGISHFKTEKQQGLCDATPDILFDDGHGLCINRIRYKWIEIKNGVIVPSLTDVTRLTKLKEQLSKYQKRYGPGILLFTKNGHSACLKDYLRADNSLNEILVMERIRNYTENYPDPADITPRIYPPDPAPMPYSHLREMKMEEVAKEDKPFADTTKSLAAMVDIAEVKNFAAIVYGGRLLLHPSRKHNWFVSEQDTLQSTDNPILILLNGIYRYWHDCKQLPNHYDYAPLLQYIDKGLLNCAKERKYKRTRYSLRVFRLWIMYRQWMICKQGDIVELLRDISDIRRRYHTHSVRFFLYAGIIFRAAAKILSDSTLAAFEFYPLCRGVIADRAQLSLVAMSCFRKATSKTFLTSTRRAAGKRYLHIDIRDIYTSGCQLGEMLLECGQYDRAIHEFIYMGEISKGYGLNRGYAFEILAEVYMKRGEIALAQEYAIMALKRNPKNDKAKGIAAMSVEI